MDYLSRKTKQLLNWMVVSTSLDELRIVMPKTLVRRSCSLQKGLEGLPKRCQSVVDIPRPIFDVQYAGRMSKQLQSVATSTVSTIRYLFGWEVHNLIITKTPTIFIGTRARLVKVRDSLTFLWPTSSEFNTELVERHPCHDKLDEMKTLQENIHCSDEGIPILDTAQSRVTLKTAPSSSTQLLKSILKRTKPIIPELTLVESQGVCGMHQKLAAKLKIPVLYHQDPKDLNFFCYCCESEETKQRYSDMWLHIAVRDVFKEKYESDVMVHEDSIIKHALGEFSDREMIKIRQAVEKSASLYSKACGRVQPIRRALLKERIQFEQARARWLNSLSPGEMETNRERKVRFDLPADYRPEEDYRKQKKFSRSRQSYAAGRWFCRDSRGWQDTSWYKDTRFEWDVEKGTAALNGGSPQ